MQLNGWKRNLMPELSRPAELGAQRREVIAAQEADESELLLGADDAENVAGFKGVAGDAVGADFKRVIFTEVLDLDLLGGGEDDRTIGDGVGRDWREDEGF